MSLEFSSLPVDKDSLGLLSIDTLIGKLLLLVTGRRILYFSHI